MMKQYENATKVSKPATVAIIIPTYNRARLLVQSLESVLIQSRPPDEILVADDGSTDETADVLAGYEHRIRYLHKPNGGVPSALNHGLAATNADYIGFIDDDDLLMPDAIQRHLEFLHSHPDIDFSYSGCYRFWSNTPPAPPYAEHLELYDCDDVAPDDLFLRALPDVGTYEWEPTKRALVLLRQAIEWDPNFGKAMACAGYCHGVLDAIGKVENPEANRRIALDLARRALRTAGDDAMALACVAHVLG